MSLCRPATNEGLPRWPVHGPTTYCHLQNTTEVTSITSARKPFLEQLGRFSCLALKPSDFCNKSTTSGRLHCRKSVNILARFRRRLNLCIGLALEWGPIYRPHANVPLRSPALGRWAKGIEACLSAKVGLTARDIGGIASW
jgi:hypothetical protein